MQKLPIDEYLSSCPYPSEAKPKIRNDLLAVSSRTPTLFISQRTFMDSGQQYRTLALEGTIPINFKGGAYNIPIVCYITRNYPHRQPVIYVVPDQEFIVVPGNYVQPDGLAKHPTLSNWNAKNSSLSHVLQQLSEAFSLECPLFRKKGPKKEPNQPQQRNQPQLQSQPQSQPLASSVLQANAKAQNAFKETYMKTLTERSELSSQLIELVNKGEAFETGEMESQRLLDELDDKICKLRETNESIAKQVFEKKSSDATVEEVLIPKNPLLHQMLLLISKGKALERASLMIHRMLDKNAISCTDFVKTFKELQNDFFMVSRQVEKAEDQLNQR